MNRGFNRNSRNKLLCLKFHILSDSRDLQMITLEPEVFCCVLTIPTEELIYGYQGARVIT